MTDRYTLPVFVCVLQEALEPIFTHFLCVCVCVCVCVLQERRSNRQGKRKKYAEDGETRVSDEETKVVVKAKKANTGARKDPAVQLFVVMTSPILSFKTISYVRIM